MVTSYHLTDEQAVLLDGHVDEKNQAQVDAAKFRLQQREKLATVDPKIAGLIADVITEAATNGELGFTYRDLDHCQICDKRESYAVYPRNSRTHNKGDKNYNKPIYIRGVDLKKSFVRVKGYIKLGCCAECWPNVKPVLVAELTDIKAQIPENITGHKPRFLKVRDVVCKKCDWHGHEKQLRKLPALMGGHYEGGCPTCDAENLMFGPELLKRQDTWQVIEVSV